MKIMSKPPRYHVYCGEIMLACALSLLEAEQWIENEKDEDKTLPYIGKRPVYRIVKAETKEPNGNN